MEDWKKAPFQVSRTFSYSANYIGLVKGHNGSLASVINWQQYWLFFSDFYPSLCSYCFLLLRSRNPDLRTHGSSNPEVYFWYPISRAYFQSRILPQFCFKIPSPELQTREIQDPEKPVGDHQIKPNIIRYLALHIDCVLHWRISFSKITKTVRAFRLVKNLWFIVPVNS